MSLEQNKAVIRRWHEILSNQDLAAFDEVLDPDYTNRSGSKSPWAAGTSGPEAMKTYFAGVFQEHPTWTIVIDDMIAEGNKVAARMTWFEEGKPTAVAISTYRLVDGKIMDDWFTSKELKS